MPATERKKAYFETMWQLLDSYTQIMIVGADNVKSIQLQRIRMGLRGNGVVLFGKNTMMRKAIRAKLDDMPELDRLIAEMVGNVGLIFVTGDIQECRKVIRENRVGAPAKAGSIAPVDVIVPAGNTGMDPNQTSFFQVLNIPTKINKGTVEIINDIHIIQKGTKVGSSESALLKKLKINPFSYGLETVNIYDEGSIYPDAVLDMTQEELITRFRSAAMRAINIALAIGQPSDIAQPYFERVAESAVRKAAANLTGLSLAIKTPTCLSIPHFVQDAVRNVVAVSLASGYEIKEAAAFTAGAAAAAAVAAAPAADAAPAASKAKEPEPEEDEEDDDMGMGLFD